MKNNFYREILDRMIKRIGWETFLRIIGDIMWKHHMDRLVVAVDPADEMPGYIRKRVGVRYDDDEEEFQQAFKDLMERISNE